MTESETETETLQRLETALQRIGEYLREPRQPASPPASPPGSNPGSQPLGAPAEIDRQELLNSLDLLIDGLRKGLESPTFDPSNDGVE